jgi:signal transduction histidine kinase
VNAQAIGRDLTLDNRGEMREPGSFARGIAVAGEYHSHLIGRVQALIPVAPFARVNTGGKNRRSKTARIVRHGNSCRMVPFGGRRTVDPVSVHATPSSAADSENGATALSPDGRAQPSEISSSASIRNQERLLACFRKALNHELPNHLVAIQGLLQVLALEDGDRLSSQGREYLQRLTAAADRTHALISALAMIGRVGHDPRPLEAIPFAEVCQEAIAEVNQLFPSRSIEYHLHELQLNLTLQRVPLRQVLVQLLRNAVQALGDNPMPRVEIGARTTSQGAEFWVADNGRGMAPERHRQLAGYFAGQEAAVNWSGLGLILVHQIVESWGGVRHVASTPGLGSVFTVKLGFKESGE